MSSGVKRVLGVIAAVAIPFAAPAIAGALGASAALAGTATGAFLQTAAGSALTGAALGGLTAGATGGNVLQGAALGGVGGFLGGGGGAGLFGGGAAAPAGTTGTTAGLAPPGSTLTAGQIAADTTGTALGATGVTAPSAGGILGSAIQGLTDPQTLARITLLAASGQVSGLSPEEQALVRQRQQELRQIANTNQQLFEQQVAAAQQFMQEAEQQAPNPEQAFAQTAMAVERRAAEAGRGATDEEARAIGRLAAIEGARTGAAAVAGEEARGRATQTQLRQAGLAAMPTAAPEGYAGMMLPLYEDLAERRRERQNDLIYNITSAAPQVFGSEGYGGASTTDSTRRTAGLFGTLA